MKVKKDFHIGIAFSITSLDSLPDDREERIEERNGRPSQKQSPDKFGRLCVKEDSNFGL